MPDPCTPIERTAVLVWLLCLGQSITAQEAAGIIGLSVHRCQVLLNELSRVLPIYRDDDHRWRYCGESPSHGLSPTYNGISARR